jgi:hypothetical protein
VQTERFKNYIQIALAAKERKNRVSVYCFDKKSGKYAGSTRFMILICS